MNHLVPPIILGMTKSPLTDKYDLSSLHTVSSGAAPLKVDLATQFQQKFPRTEIMQGTVLFCDNVTKRKSLVAPDDSLYESENLTK